MPKSDNPKASLVLRLYVAGNAPNSVRAISNAQALCDAHFPSHYELEIVDLLDHPQQALNDGVIVTPTLIRLLPLPTQKVVGTLSNAEQLLLVLAGR